MEKNKTETKIISWNVNGIRARLEAVKILAETEKPDILCLQEIKVKDSRPYLEAIPGYRTVLDRKEFFDTVNKCGTEKVLFIDPCFKFCFKSPVIDILVNTI